MILFSCSIFCRMLIPVHIVFPLPYVVLSYNLLHCLFFFRPSLQSLQCHLSAAVCIVRAVCWDGDHSKALCWSLKFVSETTQAEVVISLMKHFAIKMTCTLTGQLSKDGTAGVCEMRFFLKIWCALNLFFKMVCYIVLMSAVRQ